MGFRIRCNSIICTYTEGGIYMDTDVELISPLYPFLNHRAFTGYEKDSNMLQTAIFGAEPQS